MSGLSLGNEIYSISMSLHSSLVIPSSVLKSLRVLASLLLCVHERTSACTLAGDAGPAAGLTFEALDESVKRRFNFESARNRNRPESLDPSEDNWYEANPCRTSPYRSFQLTVGL